MENQKYSLIKCKDCGKEYSRRANACPNCSCPTEYNIEQPMKEQIKCDVEIKGNEIYGSQMPSFITWVIGLTPLIITIIVSIKEAEGLYLLAYFPSLFWLLIVILLEKVIGVNYKKKKKNAVKIMEYFKKTIPIFNEVKGNQKIVDTFNASGNNYDVALFKVYMRAYLKKADGIVITADNVSERVSGSVSSSVTGRYISGKITSHKENHLTATLVKEL